MRRRKIRRKPGRKGGRQKGDGAIKTIDAQDAFEIRRRLHAGGEPIRDKHALIFIHWRNLIAQRDDCERRLKAGEGDKWTRKRLKQLVREIDDTWRKLGAALGGMSDADASDKLAILSKAARPAIHGWQKEATRIIEGLRLVTGSSLAVQSKPSPNRELRAARQAEQAAVSDAERKQQKEKRDAPAKAYEQYLQQNPVADDLEGEEREQELQKRRDSFYAKHPQNKPTSLNRKEQARKQRAHAAKFVPSSPIPQTDKMLSFAKVDSKGEIVRGKVNVTARELYDDLRKKRHTMTIHEVRRFVRVTLKVELQSERGKRTDLEHEAG